MKIGEKIRYFRRERNMTQEELADLCDTTMCAVSAIETGERPVTPRMLDKMAKALGVSAFEIVNFGETDLVDVGADRLSGNPKLARLLFLAERMSDEHLDMLLSLAGELAE